MLHGRGTPTSVREQVEKKDRHTIKFYTSLTPYPGAGTLVGSRLCGRGTGSRPERGRRHDPGFFINNVTLLLTRS